MATHPQRDPQTKCVRDAFARDLCEAAIICRQLEMMFEALRAQLNDVRRQDVLAIGIRLCDLRLHLVDLQTRAADAIGAHDERDEQAQAGGSLH